MNCRLSYAYYVKESFSMDKAVLFWLLSDYLFQMVRLACVEAPSFVDVYLEFSPFPLREEPRHYTVTYSSGTKKGHWWNASDVSECASRCHVAISDLLDMDTYDIVLKSVKNNAVLETKPVHVDLTANLSLRTEATSTSAVFTWSPQVAIHATIISLDGHSWVVPGGQSSYRVDSLQPATLHRFSVEFQSLIEHLNVTVMLRRKVLLHTAQCPDGWVHYGRNCYLISRKIKQWQEAARACDVAAPGAHLVDTDTEEELAFVSSFLQGLNLVLLWTSLNDIQQEGDLRWADGSAYSLKSAVTSALPPNQTDCFALHLNATGPNYYFTGFFCYMPLPYMCHYRIPAGPTDFDFLLEEVGETEAVVKWSDLQAWVSKTDVDELAIQYQNESPGLQAHQKALSFSMTRVTVQGLSPGHEYLFTLRVTHLSGVTRVLGSTLTVVTRPRPPQNIRVTKVTSRQAHVCWSSPMDSHHAQFHHYLIRYVDVDADTERFLLVANQTTSAVIEGLEPYRLYRVSIQTVTGRGVESCDHTVCSVITAVSPPDGVIIWPDDVGEENVTVRWDPPVGVKPDGYFVLVQPLTTGVWPRELWVNRSLSFELSALTPGETYEISVVAVKSGNRSEGETILQTLKPKQVQIAVPYESSAYSTVLYIQKPAAGIFDGIQVTYRGGSKWTALSGGDDKVSIEGLTPGTAYEFAVQVTSGNMTSEPYLVKGVKTCLAPPTNLRAGKVSDTTIEILWSEAEGSWQTYEVMCINCADTVWAQKVRDARAVFTAITPGKEYNFSVRTEKESFKDSRQVFLQIRAAPSTVEMLVSNKNETFVTVSWTKPPGVIDGFIVSVTNGTFHRQKSLADLGQRMHMFDGLLPGATYRISIIGTSGMRRSLPTIVNVTTNPAVPVSVDFVDQDGGSMYVTWSPPWGFVDGYKVQYSSLAAKKPIHEFILQETNMRIKDLIPGTEYQFTLQSFKGSDSSKTLSKRVVKRPAPVCSLSLTRVDTSSASIAWESAAGQFDHYELSVSNASMSRTVHISKELLAFTVSGLLDGCSYNMTVDRVGNGVHGTPASLKVLTEPGRPQGVRVIGVSPQSFSLRWAVPTGCADRHRVDVLPRRGVVVLSSLPDGEMQADVSTLAPGTSYTAAVTAVASSSSFSSPVVVSITTNETFPGAPTGLWVDEIGSTFLHLSWTTPNETNGRIQSYIIEYREVCPWPTFSATPIQTGSDFPEFLLGGLNPGSTYTIQVAAENSAGSGVFSEPLIITTEEAAPHAVTNLTAFASSQSSIMVTWFLPRGTNGLITKFTIDAIHGESNTTVWSQEINAEDVLANTLPNCNDTVGMSSNSTARSLETHLAYIADPAPWSVPISVEVHDLQPYNSYTIQVSAATSSGRGPPAGQAVLTPESGRPPKLTQACLHFTESYTERRYQEVSTGDKAWSGFGCEKSQWVRSKYYRSKVSSGEVWVSAGDPNPAAQRGSDACLRRRGLNAAHRAMLPLSLLLTAAAVAGLLWPGPVDPPQNLSVWDITASSLSMSWSPPSFATGRFSYVLELHKSSGLVSSDSTLDVNFTYSGLTPYTNYSVTVRAQSAGTLGPVAEVTVLTLADTPGVVGNLSATEVDSSSLQLSWTSPSQPNGLITKYHVLVLDHSTVVQNITLIGQEQGPKDADFHDVTWSTVEMVDVSANQTFYVVRNLSAFTEYTIRVSAFTAVGEGPFTEITAITREQVPGSVMSVSYQNIGSTSILVTWAPPLSPNGRITYYALYWLDVGTNEAFRSVTNETSIVLTGLKKYNLYKLRVAASTAVGESPLSEVDDVFAVTLEDEPDSPPIHLAVYNLTFSSATVTWSPPEKPNGIIQFYQILYGNTTMSMSVNTSKPSVTLENLRPYSFYNVSARAYTKYGHGNQVSAVLEVLSGEDVPGSPPINLSCDSLGSSEVSISWHPPLRPNGIIRFYTVRFWNATHWMNLSTPSTSVTLQHLRKYANYSVVAYASTSLGDGNQSSEVLRFTTAEDVPDGPVLNLTVLSVTPTSAVVEWDPPLEPNGMVFYILSLQLVQGNGSAINRTTSDTVVLFTALRKYTDYLLRVTAATFAGQSERSTAALHLTTGDDLPGSPPVINPDWRITSCSIHLSWLPPVEPNGLITEYIVELQGPDGINRTTSHNRSITFGSLRPFTSYNVLVGAVNRRGVGPYLELLLHTDEAAPASPPWDLRVLNHTADSVWLSWRPSPEPNGVVLFYSFRVLELPSQTLMYQNSSEPITEAQLTGLRPHRSYRVSVSAFTRAGNGDQYSNPVTFTTDQTASDVVGNLSCIGVTWDSVYLEWEPPDQPNGKISHYLVQFSGQELELNLPGHQRTISGLQPDTNYTFHVRAVNSAGPGVDVSCNVSTQPESVPGPPSDVKVIEIQSTSATLSWAPPRQLPGRLQGYRLLLELLALSCPPGGSAGCLEAEKVLHVNATGGIQETILYPLAKYRLYRFSVSACTAAGCGNASEWSYVHTTPGDPDAPPSAVSALASPSSVRVQWKAPLVQTGPTSYLVDIVTVSEPHFTQTLVRRYGEPNEVEVTDLTPFTWYCVTVTAFTGDLTEARLTGKTSDPVYVRTLEIEPKDPPKNLTLHIIPDDVTRVLVTFFPPEEPNGEISAYRALVYKEDQLVFEIPSLRVIERKNQTITAIVEGLKGGHRYNMRIAAVNGAGAGPSSEVAFSTSIIAPPKPSKRPEPVFDTPGVVRLSSKTITVLMPACFFTDDHGPVVKVQIIVAEAGVMDSPNVTNWKSAYSSKPAPYATDDGFPNPECSESMRAINVAENTYSIGSDTGCLLPENENAFCNGPLKPKTRYVFKFRATNIRGQHTDTEYSDIIKTADVPMVNRDKQIIMGVLLSFLLLAILIIVICMSVRICHKQREGGTYSPRQAEITDTKFKLDHVISAADLEQKEDKLSQLLSYRRSVKPINKKVFLHHVEDLCSDNNAKFQEEFLELPKLLPDLATTDADLPWNRSKNRFTNIKPYNSNRVKLLSEPGSPGSDYINASFVSGYLCPNEFIATQGPLPGTVGDFWRMIWETRACTIVMMTQCFEKGRVRCHQYWPEGDKPISVFGDIVITKLTEDALPDWTVRVLRIERYNDYMLVNHFNFTSWPEHGVPATSTALIKFVRSIRTIRGRDRGTVVVHCSAGVGRTGVFISLDHLIQHMRDHDFIDLFSLVAELRGERMCMVQNLVQYMFLHQCALELLSRKGISHPVWLSSSSGLQRKDSLDGMEGDVELEWEETTM
ncbi:LOW QUALITY PROTEIN: phosphatidylinositol phosphatase PTPRQ-like [Brienomyrus brachyistius]|uniref:LOW QUALITY PROTEIN: phosphatidylinositol phosphatase PTPRQ-like n=1 Tax=Brienomyrus brachyistius TaxID=42636 RepID=UPI0020B3F3C2|nr:LOW QUALITY PROTEIN: phosphatidylinositol phosphatase PTPRQ-like [Brienomyrus brachyistius]